MAKQRAHRARRAVTIGVIVCVAVSGLLLVFGIDLGGLELAAVALGSAVAGVASTRRPAR